MQLSSFIGKPVISPSGDAYGYVTDVRLSRAMDKVSCIVCADDEEEEFYLPLRAVHAAADAVIAGKARLSAATGVPSPIGRLAYTHTGEALGAVADVVLEEGAEPELIIAGTDRVSVPIGLASVGENIVVYPDPAAKARAKRSRASEAPRGQREKEGPQAASPQKKSAQKGKNAQKNLPSSAPAAPSFQGDETSSPIPMSATERSKTHFEGNGANAVPLDRTNLLGKHVRRTVYDGSGMPLAVAGERITPAVLSKARRAGRLLELAVNTITQ